MSIDISKHWQTGFDDYEKGLNDLMSSYDQPDVLELGGGRRPMFELKDFPANLGSYTVNDISQTELDELPAGYETACFDVCGDASAFRGRYDIVFSRFLAEHVPDGFAMHKNIWDVLKPGGVSIHLIPTLFASPFVINRLFPERMTSRALLLFYPWRKGGKFPALYSMCRGGTPSMYAKFKSIGYAKTEIGNYYGHFYYDRIPVLRELDGFISSVAARRNWAAYTSYAVIVAYK
jgi:hypothetical protein